jgi:hypothetical protein
MNQMWFRLGLFFPPCYVFYVGFYLHQQKVFGIFTFDYFGFIGSSYILLDLVL